MLPESIVAKMTQPLTLLTGFSTISTAAASPISDALSCRVSGPQQAALAVRDQASELWGGRVEYEIPGKPTK